MFCHWQHYAGILSTFRPSSTHSKPQALTMVGLSPLYLISLASWTPSLITGKTVLADQRSGKVKVYMTWGANSKCIWHIFNHVNDILMKLARSSNGSKQQLQVKLKEIIRPSLCQHMEVLYKEYIFTGEYRNIYDNLTAVEKLSKKVRKLMSGLAYCYDWLSLRDLFSSHPYYSAYASFEPMSVSRGPVCILFGSSLFLLHALPSGCPYPCSPSALRFLSGVGSHLWSRCYFHNLFVIPADRSISSMWFSYIALCSLWLILVLLYSIEFHDDAYSSTYTDCRCISSLRLFYAIQGILSHPSLALNFLKPP